VIDSLMREADMAVTGQAPNGEEGLALIRRMRPNVAIVDINLPLLNGHQVTHQVVLDRLPTRVILLTAYDDREQAIHAMRGGAFAYCAKDVLPEYLILAVRTVMSGKYFMNGRVMNLDELEEWLSLETGKATNIYGNPGDPFYPLSSREMEVLILITQGKENKEIASIMGISNQTVKNHVTSILRKMSVADRTQAAIYALRRGWVRLSQPNPENQES
jgi:DNA-binding NarL/FixJ family response regulator